MTGITGPSRILNNPKFVEPTTVIQKQFTREPDGDGVIVDVTSVVAMSVQPLNPSRMEVGYGAAGNRDEERIYFATNRMQLQIGDVIVSNTVNYVVDKTSDWSKHGFCDGEATRLSGVSRPNSNGFVVT